MFVAVVLCVGVLLTSFLVTIGSLAVLAGRADAASSASTPS